MVALFVESSLDEEGKIMLRKIKDGIFVMAFVLSMFIAVCWLAGFDLDSQGVIQCSLADHPTNWMDAGLHPDVQSSASLTILDW